MTKSNKIRILEVVLVVGLSWASNGINFGLKNLHLAVRAYLEFSFSLWETKNFKVLQSLF